MKKIYLLLAIVLLVLSGFAFAETDTGADDDGTETDEDNTTDDDGTETKEVEIANAGPHTHVVSSTQSQLVMPIRKLQLVGHGIVISTSNPMDFMSAKAAAGIVNVSNQDGVAERSIGILHLDDDKYRLKNVVLENDTLTADIYGTDEGTLIGKFELKKYEKPGRNVWAGALKLNDKEYNAYFLGMIKTFKPVEVVRNIANYCVDNPDAEHCKKITDCKENPEKCRERITSYCENNPDDVKCKSVKKLYCLRNRDDINCEEYLKELCRENPKLAHCRIKTIQNKEIMSIKPVSDLEVLTVDESGEIVESSSGGSGGGHSDDDTDDTGNGA